LITNYGDYSTEDGIWKITVSKSDGSFSATYDGNFEKRFALGLGKLSGNVRSSISSSGWTASPGWCAFVENENRFWAYDGLTNLWMLEKTKDETVVYDISTLPCPIPLSVVSRMSPEARSFVEKTVQK
jgi:hypothetical protein